MPHESSNGSMSSAAPGLYSVQNIPGAGRGVIAFTSILQGTQVLQSQPPAAGVLHWEYRKEVCSQCFYYNLGRALPVRHSTTGKAFCSPECHDTWLAEQGQLGLSAWERLHAFITPKGNAITNAHSLPALCDKPDGEEIKLAWSQANEVAERLKSSFDHGNKKQKPPKVPMGVVDPYILFYFLSGVLLHYRDSERWQQGVQALTVNETPYQSTRDLEAHCNSFIQLASLLPVSILPSLTADLCQTLVGSASHNAFGIHFGNDGEEYMGYAVYPEASYFNHSCAPNIDKTRIGSIWHFAALRDIAEGEECCITYLGGDEKTLSVDARRARLKQHWGFICMCLRCRSESQSALDE